MPGQGRIVEREYTDDERAALGDAIPALGEKTLDVYLNDHAFWRNVPAAIWDYKTRRLSGAQKMAIVSRKRCLGADADAGGSAVLCGDDAADWGDSAGELYVMSER